MKDAFAIEKADPCQVSIDVLREKCLSFFATQPQLNAKHIWFIDHYEACPQAPDNEPVDAVFFGGFLRRFLDSGNWIEPNYRFWCVSTAARAALSHLLGLPIESIGLIPREALFPTLPSQLPERNSPMSFVFGGRLSATKNIELLLRTVHHLQRDHHFDTELILLGEFDEEDHPDRGRWSPGPSFQATIAKLTAQLDWKKKPRFIHGRRSEDWYKDDFVNPVYINLSTFISEDFDVSLAQAQSLGWPSFISDWGGHRDTKRAEGTIRIHPSLLGHAHEGESITTLRALNLAAWISNRWNAQGVGSAKSREDRVHAPQPITLEKVDSVRRAFIRKTGNGIHRINREGLDMFAHEPAGERFYAAYRNAFAGLYDGSPTAILINNFSESDAPFLRHIRAVCESVVKEETSANREVAFIPSRESLHPLYTLLATQSREVVVPFWSPHLEPLLKLWTTVLNIPGSIRIFVEKGPEAPDLGTFKALLRPQDTVSYYRVDGLRRPIVER